MNEKGEKREYTRSMVPPGFRFHPTDEELIDFYLRKKVGLDKFDLDHVIREVDLNKLEPWDLREKCKVDASHQTEWYFFSHKDKKYPTGTRTNRATKAGFWKATGRDKAILSSLPQPHKLAGQRIGMRKTLVFYKGRAPHGLKTDWIMHEYRLQDADSNHATKLINEDGWVVCRVFKKKNYEERSSTSTSSYDHSLSNLSDEEPSPIKTSNSIASAIGVGSISSSKSTQNSFRKQGETMNYSNNNNNNSINIAPTIKIGGNNLAFFSCKKEEVMDQNEGLNGNISNQPFFNQLPYLESTENIRPNYHTTINSIINNNNPSINLTYNTLNGNENQIKRVDGSHKPQMNNFCEPLNQESTIVNPPGGKAFFMNEDDLAHYIDNNMNPCGQQNVPENIQCWSLYENLARLQGPEALASFANDQPFPPFNNVHLSKIQPPLDNYTSSYEIELWNFPR